MQHQEKVERVSRREVDAPRICLIGGTGRSGTTIVRKVFARHPDVAAAVTETRFLIDPDGLVDFYESMENAWSPYVFDVKVRRLKSLLIDIGEAGVVGRALLGVGVGDAADPTVRPSQSRGRRAVKSLLNDLREREIVQRALPRYPTVNLRRYCNEYRRLVDELMEALVEFDYHGRWIGSARWQSSSVVFGPREEVSLEAALGQFYKKVARCISKEASHFVEDSPLNLLSFGSVLRILPDAKLLHMYRDPRDVVASIRGEKWGPGDTSDAIALYRRMMDRWTLVKSRLPTGTYMELSLEDLSKDPRDALSRICEFWGVSWHEDLLQVDLSKTNAGRWAIDIPPEERGILTERLQPYLSALGYA